MCAAAGQLPEYMVPTVVVAVDRFPLTTNGKVNRAELPAPTRAGAGRADAAPPVGPTEEMIAAAWRDLLGLDTVGRDDNFFDLGGQSLLAINLVAQLRRHTGQPIPLVTVFRYPVLHELATYLEPGR